MNINKRKAYNKLYYDLHREEILRKRNKGTRNDRPLSIGEVFFDLTVASLCEKDKDGKICYLCKCKCGKERKVRRSYLVHGTTKSCGCGRKVASSVTAKKNVLAAIAARKRFVGDLGGSMWSRILKNATVRGISVSLTQEEAWTLFIDQRKKCALTGLDLYLHPHHKDRNLVTASLDRIDSTQGYIKGNVQWVHKDVNRMKNGFSEVRFKEICRLVVNHDN